MGTSASLYLNMVDINVKIALKRGDRMNTVKILHCADLHIGQSVSQLGEKGVLRRNEALITFENIINLAREHSVDFLLISGDLLSSNSIEEHIVSRVLESIASIPDIKVIFAAGNHDPLNSESPFTKRKLPSNLYVLPAKDTVFTFDDKNCRIYGRSFSEVYLEGEARFSLPADDNFINIMCQHGEVRHDLSSNYNSITPEFIDTCDMDYIALGHIHKRSEIAKRGNTCFAYCGCAEGLGFDELGDKGVYIGEVGKGYVSLSFFRTCLRTNERVEIDVSDCEDSPAVAEKTLSVLSGNYESFADNLYKIILVGDIPFGRWFDAAEIESRLLQSVYYAKVKDETEIAVDLELIKNENSLKGIFVSKMLDLIKQNPNEEEKLKKALNIGLKAFSTEVDFNGN